jgi:hypothetical protein
MDRKSSEIGIVLILLSMVPCCAFADADAKAPTVTEVREHYMAALQALNSIEVRYDFEQAAAASVLEADGLPVARVVPLIHVRALRQPGRWRNETTILASEGGPRDSFAINSFDGTHVYVAYNDKGSETLEVAHVGIRSPVPEHPADEHTTHIDDFLGIRLIALNRNTRSLATLLDSEPQAAVVRDDVAGHSCWRVQLGKDREVDGRAYEITAWFDPAGGWLVRKLEGRVWDATGDPEINLPGGEVTFSLFVDEFVPVEGESADVWFPKSAVLAGKYATSRLQVNSVQSARNFAIADFVPTIPVGAEVVETLPDESHRSYRYGVRNVAATVRTALPPQPPLTAVAMPTEAVIEAQPSRTMRWTLLVAAGALAAGIAAVYLKRRGA